MAGVSPGLACLTLLATPAAHYACLNLMATPAPQHACLTLMVPPAPLLIGGGNGWGVTWAGLGVDNVLNVKLVMPTAGGPVRARQVRFSLLLPMTHVGAA